MVSPKHVDSTEKRSYIFLQCKLKFFCNDLGTSLNISGQRPYAEHRFSNFPIQFNSLNPRKRVRSHHYEKDSPKSHKHTPTPRAFYLLIIQHRWRCHTICSLRIKKLERKTRETWKYVHVFSRSWRLNSADSTCSFFPLEDVVAISAKDCTTIKQHFTVTMTEQRSFHLKISFFTKVMATIAIHRVSTTRWVHRKSFVHFSAMQGQILLERAWYKLEYLWAAPVCRILILKLSKPSQFS